MADPLARYIPGSETLARSLLDRLLDLQPDLASDRPQTIGAQTQELRESLRRDLEALLNTRRCPVALAEDPQSELADSLLTYGADGFFTTSLVTDQQRDEFARSLAWRIKRGEPRLEDVQVSVLPPRLPGERSLRLRIEAVYKLQRGLPAIAYETSIDPTTQRLQIEAAHV